MNSIKNNDDNKLYCVEVFYSESGWKTETWINEYKSETEAKEFINESNRREKEKQIACGNMTPREYYKVNYLGEKQIDKKGKESFEFPFMFN